MNEEDNLVSSLARAQTKIRNARKDAKNSFLGNEYATLASVYDACRDALSSEGIAVVQAFLNETIDGKQVTFIKTSLMKGSQSIASTLPLQWVKDWHSLGSAITYARRYSLSALVGLSESNSDDDGCKAQGMGTTPAPAPKPQPKKEPEPDPKAEARAIIKSVEGAEGWLADITGEKDLEKMLSGALIKRINNLGAEGLKEKIGGSK
jgi:hypothetical protein